MEFYAHALWLMALFIMGILVYTFFFPDWMTKHRRQDAFLLTLQTLLQQHAELTDRLLSNQESTQSSIAGMVEQMAAATAKQAESFTAYLNSFSSTEPNRHWIMKEGQELDMAELAKRGFPINASPEEQAAWMEEYMEGMPW